MTAGRLVLLITMVALALPVSADESEDYWADAQRDGRKSRAGIGYRPSM